MSNTQHTRPPPIRPYNEIILLDRVVHTIERHRMFTPGDRVAVAVSGGADSVCLLHVLRDLAPRWNLSLGVVHINHNLRGDASRGDAEFVRSLAAGCDLPFTLHHLDLATAPGNLEQSARLGRLALPPPPPRPPHPPRHPRATRPPRPPRLLPGSPRPRTRHPHRPRPHPLRPGRNRPLPLPPRLRRHRTRRHPPRHR